MQTAVEESRQQQVDPRELLTEEFIDAVTDPDLDPDLPDDHPGQRNIEQKMGALGSKQLALGNIGREEWREQKLKDKGRRHFLQMHYRRPAGIGAECTGRTHTRYTGGDGDERPKLTPDLDEQLDAAMQTRTMTRSGAVSGRILRLIGETQVVTRQEGYKQEAASEGGVLAKVTGALGL